MMSKSFNHMPGPGAYSGDYKTIAKNAPYSVFGSSGRNKNSFYDTNSKYNPGPGTYQHKKIVGADGRYTTISPRRPDTSPHTGVGVPGPGTYNQDNYVKTMKSISAARIGTS